MYIERTQTLYGAGGEQRAARAWFLLLIARKGGPNSAENTYGIIRRVALRQFGHFMMGRANLGGLWVTLSGAYGNDGLILDVETLPHDAKALPPALYDAWAKGGGWNGPGAEAQALKTWAGETFAAQIKRHAKR